MDRGNATCPLADTVVVLIAAMISSGGKLRDPPRRHLLQGKTQARYHLGRLEPMPSERHVAPLPQRATSWNPVSGRPASRISRYAIVQWRSADRPPLLDPQSPVPAHVRQGNQNGVKLHLARRRRRLEQGRAGCGRQAEVIRMMVFEDFRKERFIIRTLRRLSRQRVALVLQPGNIWVIEKAVKDDKRSDAALKTCYMRGWVEPIEHAVPTGTVSPEGRLPEGSWVTGEKPIFRLTDSGWAVINRSHQLAVLGTFLALLALIVAYGAR
jgi:hypothetical protein